MNCVHKITRDLICLAAVLAWWSPHVSAAQAMPSRGELWLEPQVPENWGLMVQEAMAAQLAGIGVALDTRAAPPLTQREAAISRAKSDQLLVIYVFGAATTGQASLTIIDVQHDRAVGRSLQADSDTRGAMAEAAALIARDAAMAIRQGIPPPPEPEPAATTAPTANDAEVPPDNPTPTTAIGTAIAEPTPQEPTREPSPETEVPRTPNKEPKVEPKVEPPPNEEEGPKAEPTAKPPTKITKAEDQAIQPTKRQIQVQAGYQLDRVAAELGASHGLVLHLDYRGLSPWLFAVQGGYVPSNRASSKSTTVVVDIQRIPVSLLAGMHRDMDRLSLSLSAGAGLEAWIRNSERIDKNFDPTSAHTRLRYAFLVQASAQMRLLDAAGIFASAEACIFANNFKYITQSATQPKSETVISPAWVAPRLIVGIFAQL